MENNFITILIVDDGSADRCFAMVNAFRNKAMVYRYNGLKKQIQSDQEEMGLWKNVDIAPHFDMILVHGHEARFMTKFTAKMTICFSGAEGYDARFPDADYQIYRPIRYEEEVLTVREVRQLLQFFQDRQLAIPKFLIAKKEGSEETLDALLLGHSSLMENTYLLCFALNNLKLIAHKEIKITLEEQDRNWQNIHTQWIAYKNQIVDGLYRHLSKATCEALTDSLTEVNSFFEKSVIDDRSPEEIPVKAMDNIKEHLLEVLSAL